MDFEADGLLDELEGAERESRLRLLRELARDGVSRDELLTAVKEDRLALLPVERVLGGARTAAEIEAQTGVPADLLVRLRRMIGLPEPAPTDRVFGDEDVETARSARTFIEAGLSEDALAEMTRVLGESMARLAATTAAAFVETFLVPGDTEYDVAMRFATLAEELAPAMHPVLISAYTAHLREATRRGIIGRAEREAGEIAGDQDVTVCFADLVGFTSMGAQVEVQELGSVAGKLAELASECARPPVRLIKTIGDAAMFVSPEPEPMVAVALDLVQAVQAADLPSLRAGVADGPALLRTGDYYGHSVNLASRVTGVARPDSVLCTKEVHDAAPDSFEWSFAGRHRLKGLGERVPLYRARPLSSGEDDHSSRRARPEA